MGHDEPAVSEETQDQARLATGFTIEALLPTQATARVGYSVADVPLTDQAT